MTQPSGSPRKILAVMNDGEAQIALVSAAALAERHGAALEIVGCIEPPHDLGVIARVSGRDPDRLFDALYAETEKRMKARVADLLPGHEGTLLLRVGKTYIEIIKHVIESDFDFVVKGAEPLAGVHKLLFASTDQHLLRKCPCPVWLQTPNAGHTAKHVIAAVDLDVEDAAEPETLMSLNRRVIETACMVAAPRGAQIVVLHAWEAIGEGMVWAFSSNADGRLSADAYVNEILDTRRQAMTRLLRHFTNNRSGGTELSLIPRLVRGAPEQVIEEQARELSADLVVMGTVARTGLSGVFIGNTAENIINNLECPVLAVKPDGFVSPLDTRNR